MNTDFLIDQICEEIERRDATTDVASTIVDVMLREEVDLKKGPSLSQMKVILVAACRAAENCHCVMC